jgi:hypothetical protein
MKAREIINLDLKPVVGLYLNELNGQTFVVDEVRDCLTFITHPEFFAAAEFVTRKISNDYMVKMIVTGQITYIGEV